MYQKKKQLLYHKKAPERCGSESEGPKFAVDLVEMFGFFTVGDRKIHMWSSLVFFLKPFGEGEEEASRVSNWERTDSQTGEKE